MNFPWNRTLIYEAVTRIETPFLLATIHITNNASGLQSSFQCNHKILKSMPSQSLICKILAYFRELGFNSVTLSKLLSVLWTSVSFTYARGRICKWGVQVIGNLETAFEVFGGVRNGHHMI